MFLSFYKPDMSLTAIFLSLAKNTYNTYTDMNPKGHKSDYTHPAVQGLLYCNKLFEYEHSHIWHPSKDAITLVCKRPETRRLRKYMVKNRCNVE
jgi:hypothetical protein